MEIVGSSLQLETGMFADLSFCSQSGGGDAESSLVENEGAVTAIVVGMNSAIDGNLPCGRGSTVVGCAQGQIRVCAHIAYAPGPRSSGRSAKGACHCDAIKFRLLSHALRGLERDVAQGCVDARS